MPLEPSVGQWDEQARTWVICGVGSRFIFSTPITRTMPGAARLHA